MEPPEADYERLMTYCKDLTSYKSMIDNILAPCTRSDVLHCDFGLGIGTEDNVDNGFYVDFKIGYKTAVAFGGEGSFKMLFKTQTKKDVTADTHIKGTMELPDNDRNRIKEFSVQGYWLKPNNDGFWVPEYRRKMGDKPWFITYRVTSGYRVQDPNGYPFVPYCP